MKIPAVSVIVSVYNGEKYLPECLESILAQTLQNIEIICVDDASTDATPQILDRYKEHMTILTNNKNCMTGESRNRGFGAARGEYVLFLDADDVFEADMLEKAYKKAEGCEADICIFRENLFMGGVENSYSYPYAEELMKLLGERDFFSPMEFRDILFNLWNGWAWDKLFRRKFILDAGLKFPDIQTSEDGFFVHAAMAAADRISYVNEVLAHHRVGDGSSLSNTRDCAWESCLFYLNKLAQYLKQKKLFLTFERSYINWAVEFLYWNYQTLNEANRKRLSGKMKLFLGESLNTGQYEEEYFYNAFSHWFVHCIMSGGEDKIPLTEAAYYEMVYQLNDSRLEKLHQYITGHFRRIALWGAGIRGRAFARVHGEKWTRLQNVYDMDQGKHGQELRAGLVVKEFVKDQKETDCILVLNAAHVRSVYEIVKGEQIALFDMNTYLVLPSGIEECLIDCGSGGL